MLCRSGHVKSTCGPIIRIGPEAVKDDRPVSWQGRKIIPSRRPHHDDGPLVRQGQEGLGKGRAQAGSGHGRAAPWGALLLFHRALQRVLVPLGKIHDLRNLRLRDLEGEDTHDRDPFLVNSEHQFQVVAVNLVGASNISRAVTASTLPYITVPDIPVLHIPPHGITGGSITVEVRVWDTGGEAPTELLIQ